MKDEKGQILPLALAAMTLGILMVIPFLQYATTAVRGSGQYQEMAAAQYSADSGAEHAMWRIAYEDGFVDTLTEENPTVQYTLTVNGMEVPTTVTMMLAEPPPDPGGGGDGEQSWRVDVDKSVEPVSAPLGEPTTFTYTIYIENTGTSTVHLEGIGDLLPEGFEYVPLSSSGVTTAEPAVEYVEGRQELTWSFSSPLPSIGAGETATQVFQATATLVEGGIYWNEAWVIASPDSIEQIESGSSSPVGGGCSPYVYDITSSAGGREIRARVEPVDSEVAILSWQAE